MTNEPSRLLKELPMLGQLSNEENFRADAKATLDLSPDILERIGTEIQVGYIGGGVNPTVAEELAAKEGVPVEAVHSALRVLAFLKTIDLDRVDRRDEQRQEVIEWLFSVGDTSTDDNQAEALDRVLTKTPEDYQSLRDLRAFDFPGSVMDLSFSPILVPKPLEGEPAAKGSGAALRVSYLNMKGETDELSLFLSSPQLRNLSRASEAARALALGSLKKDEHEET